MSSRSSDDRDDGRQAAGGHTGRDPQGHAESARHLADEAAEHVGRGYDATQEAAVHEQRRQGRADEDAEDDTPTG